MKNILCAITILLCAGSAFAKGSDSKLPYVQKEFSPDKNNRKLGYQLIDDAKQIVFIFDAQAYGIKMPKKVFVEGSFNGWSKGKNTAWQLEKGKKFWTLTCDVEDIKVPGNSGFPEFKFYVIADVEYTVKIIEAESVRLREEIFEPNPVAKIPGFQMSNNNLILFPSDNPQVIVENTKIANKQKKLKEFNLNNDEDLATLANFRLVPGTKNLFRGYHPYKTSRQFDTEKKRIETVNKLIEKNGIKSIITLSGNEKITGKEEISQYIQGINYAGNHLFIDTSYNTVYYNSTSSEYGNLIAQVIRFINGHPAPYYIHCRLGTDRTGAFSAILAALCGANWNEICADYQKTNEMGIKEFRDYRLLQYSFEKILDRPMNEVENLQSELSDYLVRRNFLAKEEIDAAAKKLTE